MSKIETIANVQSAYDEQYTDRMTAWRELGAKYKAQNILEMVGKQVFPKVLEFGAGEGSILKYLEKNDRFSEFYALEISDSGIEQIKNRNLNKLKEIKKFDGYNTDYKDKAFDLVYCSHVIEHVEHPRLVLREIKRISKHQIFEIPLDYKPEIDKEMDHFLGYGHINIFTPSLFKFLLKSEGFSILDEKYSPIERAVLEFNWFNNLKMKKSLLKRLKAFYISKRPKLIGLLSGTTKAKEFNHSAYTCLTDDSGELKIF
jgi:ubiquinone/menaquinone biosynthesis C-methylase UbiE